MEFDENNGFDQQQEDYVEIYSRNAVLWFSILADPLIGGILLCINLWTVGYKKAVAFVVGFLIIYGTGVTLAEYWFIDNFKINQNLPKLSQNDAIFLGGSLALRILGALILTQFFYKKYFPDNDYYPKSVLQPLFITVLLLFIMQYIGISF